MRLNYNPLAEDLVDRVRIERQRGMSYKDIAALLGISKSVVVKYCADMDVKEHARPSRAQIDVVVDRFRMFVPLIIEVAGRVSADKFIRQARYLLDQSDEIVVEAIGTWAGSFRKFASEVFGRLARERGWSCVPLPLVAHTGQETLGEILAVALDVVTPDGVCARIAFGDPQVHPLLMEGPPGPRLLPPASRA
jgi:transcriptional regulator with XRE-family HTH domain